VNRVKWKLLVLGGMLSAFGLVGCPKKEEPPPPPAPAATPVVKGPIVNADQRKMFQPLPDKAPGADVPAELIALGQTLYHEPRLSKSQTISCNSCHKLEAFGVDNEPTSLGATGERGGRNSPTTFNATLHIAQFWDGRAKDLEEQAKGPVLNPVEHALKDDKEAVAILKSIPGYTPMFQAAFPNQKDPITWDNFAIAVAAFERQLLTPSRYDLWAKGDDTALTQEEQQGALAFMTAGCMTCHMGPAFGGNMYQKAGLVKPWPNQSDPGRKGVTGNEADALIFKVPSLRNIEKTGPYFHDGSTARLEDAIEMMGNHQLGKNLSDEEVKSIVTFLRTLTAEPAKELLAVPTLPESGPKTPKPPKG
jgi:cytochrome c peroxidase